MIRASTPPSREGLTVIEINNEDMTLTIDGKVIATVVATPTGSRRAAQWTRPKAA